MTSASAKLIEDMKLSPGENSVAATVAIELLEATMQASKRLPPGVGLIALLAGHGAATKALQEIVRQIDEEFKNG